MTQAQLDRLEGAVLDNDGDPLPEDASTTVRVGDLLAALERLYRLRELEL